VSFSTLAIDLIALPPYTPQTCHWFFRQRSIPKIPAELELWMALLNRFFLRGYSEQQFKF
jgi:hypothetical protein